MPPPPVIPIPWSKVPSLPVIIHMVPWYISYGAFPAQLRNLQAPVTCNTRGRQVNPQHGIACDIPSTLTAYPVFCASPLRLCGPLRDMCALFIVRAWVNKWVKKWIGKRVAMREWMNECLWVGGSARWASQWAREWVGGWAGSGEWVQREWIEWVGGQVEQRNL